MSALRSKIFGITAMALAFAGASYGQLQCGASVTGATGSSSPTVSQATFLRAEGAAELTGDVTFGCGGTLTTAGSTTAITIQVFMSAPVTSKTLSSTTGATEAMALLNGGAVLGAQGTVNGSTVTFNIPSSAISSIPFTVTLTNIRVNATGLAVSTGAPTAVTSTIFLSGPSTAARSTSAQTVGFVQNGIAAGKIASITSFVVCSPATVAAPAFTLTAIEGFSTAFKVAGNATTNNALINGTNPGIALNTESGDVFTATFGNVANSGTRLKVTFSNVPTGVNVYVPVGIGNNTAAGTSSTGNILLTATESGAFSAATAVASSTTGFSAYTGGAVASNNGNFAPNGGLNTGATKTALSLVSISSTGTGSAVYEISAADPGLVESYSIPVYLSGAPTSLVGTSAITASISFAPVAATSNIPNFAVGSTTNTLTGSAFTACTTSLLFPFITNQVGFDTGIAIANTTTDPFGTSGATPNAGTCTLNFYGSGAPTPSAVATPSIPSGTVYSFVVSSVAAGFQGYMIAQCNFQFAHAYGYIAYGLGTNAGVAQGYVANVIPDPGQVKRGTAAATLIASGDYTSN